MRKRLLIACDFDGTVTRNDTLVEILDRFGAPDWKKIQERVVSGESSIREGLELEMGSVRASADEMRRHLCARVELEPSFPSFFQLMRSRGIPVVLLSGGFDFCVETVLAGKPGLWPIPFLANRLICINGNWKVQFPYPSLDCQACGHCKADPIQTWNAQGYTTVFVGNGVTDRCAASAAGLTFAKDELAEWCRRKEILMTRYETFNDIRKELEQREWL